MENLAQINTYSFYLPIFDIRITINPVTLITTWGVIFFLIIAGFLFSRGLKKHPGRKQIAIELLIKSFDNILEQSLGKDGRKFLPVVLTLFLFVLLSNWLTIIPGVKAPTRDLNTCLGLAIMVLFIAHGFAIKKKGLKGYIKNYFKPYWFLFPSNVFAEFSKTLSHSFRLFGNIFAGGVIVASIPIIIWQLFKWWGIPLHLLGMPVINAFFGLFIGSIQAFVFSMLAVAYITVLSEE